MEKTLSVIVILGATMTAYGFYGTRAIEIMPNVSTVTVTEGDIVDTIGATGALEAVTTVQVGSQVSRNEGIGVARPKRTRRAPHATGPKSGSEYRQFKASRSYTKTTGFRRFDGNERNRKEIPAGSERRTHHEKTTVPRER